MKNRLLILFSLSILILASCKKDEKKEYYEGGTAPVLNSSVNGTIELSSATKDAQAVKLSWTNPNYLFTTGISSQDVAYTIQIDTAGSNFSNPDKQEVTVSKELGYAITVGDLNKYLLKMKLAADVPHDIEMRVVSNLNGAVPMISNVLKFTGVVPYEDFAVKPPTTNELYITGDATPSGWTNNPPASQMATRVDKGEYYIVMDFQPGFYYKFLSNLNQWQPQYGGKSATGGDIGLNDGSTSDPDAIPTPAVAGTYKVTLNFRTGKYKVEKQ
jgi:starch-binding outer membrane protein SusE/F